MLCANLDIANLPSAEVQAQVSTVLKGLYICQDDDVLETLHCRMDGWRRPPIKVVESSMLPGEDSAISDIIL